VEGRGRGNVNGARSFSQLDISSTKTKRKKILKKLRSLGNANQLN
jgi:hypothetical protein